MSNCNLCPDYRPEDPQEACEDCQREQWLSWCVRWAWRLFIASWTILVGYNVYREYIGRVME